MQATVTTKPIEQVISAINALDLESVKLRVMDTELGKGWTREYADRITLAYRNYLVMLAKYQDHAEDILLSKDVDEFWHTHILQTMKYAEDCKHVFGQFLHHSPHVGERSPADLEKRERMAEKTRDLYEREFGGAQGAESAWAGSVIREGNAAFSNAAVRADNAAFSNAAIQAGRAAFSNAAIQAGKAAFSNAAIQAGMAAFSNAAIKPVNAAFSNAAITTENAAFSNAAIRAENAAFSNAAIRAENAAFSNAAIGVAEQKTPAVSA